MFRADCHVHLSRIGGPHPEAPPSPAELDAYVRSEGLSWLFGIYESDADLAAFRSGVSARIIGFYWSRRPAEEALPESAEGLKLHPYLDRYPLELEGVRAVLESAARRSVPILIHADDRTPEVSRPSRVARLADAFPEARFIIAHAGSYAPPPGGPFPVEDARVEELVGEAIEVADGRRNVWLESSVLARLVKARLLAERGDPGRFLLGSDYPILKESHGSIRVQEDELIGLGWAEEAIRRVHENAKQVCGPNAVHSGSWRRDPPEPGHPGGAR